MCLFSSSLASRFQFQKLVSSFFLFLILFQLFSNLILRRAHCQPIEKLFCDTSPAICSFWLIFFRFVWIQSANVIIIINNNIIIITEHDCTPMRKKKGSMALTVMVFTFMAKWEKWVFIGIVKKMMLHSDISFRRRPMDILFQTNPKAVQRDAWNEWMKER